MSFIKTFKGKTPSAAGTLEQAAKKLEDASMTTLDRNALLDWDRGILLTKAGIRVRAGEAGGQEAYYQAPLEIDETGPVWRAIKFDALVELIKNEAKTPAVTSPRNRERGAGI